MIPGHPVLVSFEAIFVTYLDYFWKATGYSNSYFFQIGNIFSPILYKTNKKIFLYVDRIDICTCDNCQQFFSQRCQLGFI